MNMTVLEPADDFLDTKLKYTATNANYFFFPISYHVKWSRPFEFTMIYRTYKQFKILKFCVIYYGPRDSTLNWDILQARKVWGSISVEVLYQTVLLNSHKLLSDERTPISSQHKGGWRNIFIYLFIYSCFLIFFMFLFDGTDETNYFFQ